MGVICYLLSCQEVVRSNVASTRLLTLRTAYGTEVPLKDLVIPPHEVQATECINLFYASSFVNTVPFLILGDRYERGASTLAHLPDSRKLRFRTIPRAASPVTQHSIRDTDRGTGSCPGILSLSFLIHLQPCCDNQEGLRRKARAGRHVGREIQGNLLSPQALPIDPHILLLSQTNDSC